MCMNTHMYNAYFLKSCRKSCYNGIVSYLKHMGRGRILEYSNCGGLVLEDGGHAVPFNRKTGLAAAVLAAPTSLSQQVLLWHKNSLWGIQHNTMCKMKKQNRKSFSECGIPIFPATWATKPVANTQVPSCAS